MSTGRDDEVRTPEPGTGTGTGTGTDPDRGPEQSVLRGRGQLRRGAGVAAMGTRIAVSRVARRVRSRLAPAERRDEVARAVDQRAAAHLASSLGQMKGALMKLGQLASFLDEGLPEPYRLALAQLQAAAPPMPAAVAARVVESELGRSPAKLFASWDPEPVAAASIGQVHRATRRDGRVVAVKVQYPGVAEAIRADLANTALLGRMLPVVFPSLDPAVLVTELRDRIGEELDYRHEATNQQAFVDHYQGHPFIHVPAVHHDLTTSRVLTTDFVTGARFEEVVSWDRAQRDLAGETLFRFVFRSIHRLGMFNGDPHPGNYLFGPDGQVTFLDFGLVKTFTPTEVRVFHDMIETLVLRGDGDAYRRTLEGVGLLRRDPALTTDEVVAFFAHFHDLVMRPGRRTVGRDYAAETVRRVLDTTSPVARDVDLPPMFVIVQRINLGLYALLARLEATADWRRIAEELWPMTDGPPAGELGRAERRWSDSRGQR